MSGRAAVMDEGMSEGFSVFFPPGYTHCVSPQGCHVELDQAIAALATALSQACGPPTGALRKVNTQGNHSLTVQTH